MSFNAVKTLLIFVCMLSVFNVHAQNTEDFYDSMDGFFDDQVLDIPEVLTAARLRQSQLDTPASVTIIEAETIAALGFKDIEDIFRLVPGMLVGYHSGFGEKAPSVSYHGTNAPEHRRLQVLIDGRSVFKPGLARVEWVDIPLAVEDIARIEVIRGPNSAAYGANSYLGIINILTKHPQDEKSTTVKVTAGTRDVANSYINIASSIANTDYRWTFGSKNKSGFDTLDNGQDHRDSVQGIYTNLRTYTQLNKNTNMQWQAGYKSGTNGQRPLYLAELTYNEDEDIKAKDYFIWAKFSSDISTSQSAHLQIYSQRFIRDIKWDACFTQDFADLINQPVVCGLFDKSLDEIKSEIEYQQTSIWSDQLRTVVGARVRLDEFISETYNSGYSRNLNQSVFLNAEYKWQDLLTFNLGGMYEDDELNGGYFSPRLAVNVHLSELNTLRLIYSEAIRSPDLYEQNGKLIFTIRNARLQNGTLLGFNPELPVGVVESDLDYEKIYSNEISYMSLMPSFNAQLDVKIFHDNLTGLISESLEHDIPLTNTIHLEQSGIEGQLKVKPNADNEWLMSFAYLDVNDDFPENKNGSGNLTKEAERESSLSAEYSGSVAWLHRINSQTRFASALYHVNNWNPYVESSPGGYEFTRLDLNMSKDLLIQSAYTLTLEGNLQYRFDDDPLVRDKNNYDDKYLVYISGKLKF